MGSLIAALRRRKLLTLIAVLLAAGIGYGVAMRGGPTYTYSSTTLLLPPAAARNVAPDTTDYTAGNPLFYLSNLGQARDILIGAMTSKDVQEQVAEAFPGTTYTVSGDILNSAPVVILSATGPDQEASKGLVAQLSRLLPSVLVQVQEGVGVEPAAQIKSFQLASDARPAISHKGQVRMAIVSVGASAVLLVFVIGAIDGVLRSRRERATRRTTPAPDPPTDDDAESPTVEPVPDDGPRVVARNDVSGEGERPTWYVKRKAVGR